MCNMYYVFYFHVQMKVSVTDVYEWLILNDVRMCMRNT